MAKYKIKHTSIMHNGTVYKEGSIIELTDKQAKRLEDFVEFIPEKSQTENKTKNSNTQKSKTSKKSVKSNNETSTKEEKTKDETETKVVKEEGETTNDK